MNMLNYTTLKIIIKSILQQNCTFKEKMNSLIYQYNGQYTPTTEELECTLKQLHNDAFVIRTMPFDAFIEQAKVLLHGQMTNFAESYRKAFFEVLFQESSKEFHVQDAFEKLMFAVSDVLKLEDISGENNDDDDKDADDDDDDYQTMNPQQAIQYHKNIIQRHAERLVDLIEEEAKSLHSPENRHKVLQQVSEFQYHISNALHLMNVPVNVPVSPFHKLQLE